MMHGIIQRQVGAVHCLGWFTLKRTTLDGENARQKNLKTKQIQLVEILWLFNGSVNSKNHIFVFKKIQFGNEIRFLFLNAIWDLTTW